MAPDEYEAIFNEACRLHSAHMRVTVRGQHITPRDGLEFWTAYVASTATRAAALREALACTKAGDAAYYAILALINKPQEGE